MKMSRRKFEEFCARIDAETTLNSTFGTYASVISKDGKIFQVDTPSLCPDADWNIREITREEADQLVMESYSRDMAGVNSW